MYDEGTGNKNTMSWVVLKALTLLSNK
eukprot:COSAG02_NODE_36359_length_455_cov_1.702247_1_plen_26_part_10